MPLPDGSRRAGLSRVDALVVLVVMLAGVGLVVPGLRQARAAEDQQQCTNNLKQLVLAVHNINDVYGKLPPAVGAFPAQQGPPSTLFYQILPFIERQQVYNQGAGAPGPGGMSPWLGSVYSTPIETYLCPEDKSGSRGHLYRRWLATSSYAANYQVFKATDGGSARIPGSFPDGTSNTIVFAERYETCGGQPNAWAYSSLTPWAPVFGYSSTDHYQVKPAAESCDPSLTQTAHPRGMGVGIADGTVRILPAGMSEKTWQRACDPADGQVLGEDWPKE